MANLFKNKGFSYDINHDINHARALIKKCLENKENHLNISNCGLTDLADLPELFECVHLEYLILSGESHWFERLIIDQQETTVKFDRNHGQENKINCLPKQIKNLGLLKGLCISGGLRGLKVWGNRLAINDLTSLTDMYSLEYLLCNYTNVKDLTPLAELSQLQRLECTGNQISDLSPLAGLSQLQRLGCTGNQISDLSPLAGLSQLCRLYLSNNQVSNLSPLAGLSQLCRLYLNNNQVSNLSPLAGLSQLRELDFGDNQVSNLSPLAGLSQLRELYFDNNKVSNLSPLARLSQLQRAIFTNNEVSDLSPLAGLSQLQWIYFIHNQVSNLSPLAGLSQLCIIDFRNNQVSDLTPIIPLQNFKDFDFNDNPITTPPPEVVRLGSQAMQDWLKANKQALNEIKVILIGDPKAGKTSLLRRLLNDGFEEKEVQTDGVNIEDISFSEAKTFAKCPSLHGLTGHFWDFGGQEIMNATHQFFLTSRAVYVLVLEARKDNKVVSKLRDWIQQIQMTGGDSAIIVVANQLDIHPSFGFENEVDLQQEFPQIKDFIKLSCKTGDNLIQLKQALATWIPQADLFNSEIDVRWLQLKDRLLAELDEYSKQADDINSRPVQQRYFLNEDTFRQLAKEVGLNQQYQQNNAIRFLHDLGLVLHFDDLELSEYFVLDPYWITYGVYQILTSQQVGEQQGYICMDQLDHVINIEPDKTAKYQPQNFKKITYSTNERRFLVDILNQFKLCFYISNRKQVIIPDLLKTEEPKHITQEIRSNNNAIRLVYDYKHLPKSILPNVMVLLHQQMQQIWRTGIVLKWQDSQALITSYDKRIEIQVAGQNKVKRELMAICRVALDQANQHLTQVPQVLIPLNHNSKPNDGRVVSYKELLLREKQGKAYYEHYDDVTNDLVEYDISQLLDGIATTNESSDILQQNKEIFTELSRQVEGIIVTQQDHTDMLVAQNEHLKQLLYARKENHRLATTLMDQITQLSDQQQTDAIQIIDNKLNELLDNYRDKLSYDVAQLVAQIKQSKHQTKLELSVPLLNLIGINLKHEVNLDVQGYFYDLTKKYDIEIFWLLAGEYNLARHSLMHRCWVNIRRWYNK